MKTGRQIIKQTVKVRVTGAGAAPVGGSTTAIPYPQYVSSYNPSSTPSVNAGGAAVGQGVGGSINIPVQEQFSAGLSRSSNDTSKAFKFEFSPMTPLRPMAASVAPLGQYTRPGDGPDGVNMEDAFAVPSTAADRAVAGTPQKTPGPRRVMFTTPPGTIKPPAKRRQSFYQRNPSASESVSGGAMFSPGMIGGAAATTPPFTPAAKPGGPLPSTSLFTPVGSPIAFPPLA
jgi:hypothetical protein